MVRWHLVPDVNCLLRAQSLKQLAQARQKRRVDDIRRREQELIELFPKTQGQAQKDVQVELMSIKVGY